MKQKGFIHLLITIFILLLILILILYIIPNFVGKKSNPDQNPTSGSTFQLPANSSVTTYTGNAPGSSNSSRSNGNPVPTVNPLSSTTVNSTPGALIDLDDQTGWNTYIDPPGKLLQSSLTQNQPSPSLDNNAMTLGIIKGDPYTNIRAFYLTSPRPQVKSIDLSLAYYLPDTLYNNVGGNSLVQAVEFSVMKHSSGQELRWAANWQNVAQSQGRDGTLWTIWDGSNWASTGVTEQLATQKWHTFELKGYIDAAGNTHYSSFSSDGVNHDLSSFAFAPTTSSDNDLEVAVQLDGNFSDEPYNVSYDKINFSTSN